MPPFHPLPLSLHLPKVPARSPSPPPEAAEIYVDGKFHGHAPTTRKLPAGSQTILLKSPGRADNTRVLEIRKSSELSRKAVFSPLQDE
jgi:hypothetical protein